ncbi:MAG: hypothetical protein Q8P35_02290 [Candidatus Yanofskybacteria bacterium]|nr:hypothetical protein [Candidatus Yanofskybacteria bacterium]
MNKILILLVIALAVVAGFFVIRNENANDITEATPTPTASMQITATMPPSVSPTANPTSSPSSGLHTVRLTAQGAMPSQLAIKVGDTVRFVNEDSAPHWPASGPHPTHTTCPGFDAKKSLTQGESYSFKFTVAKTCPFHDHLDVGDANKGSIIVSN